MDEYFRIIGTIFILGMMSISCGRISNSSTVGSSTSLLAESSSAQAEIQMQVKELEDLEQKIAYLGPSWPVVKEESSRTLAAKSVLEQSLGENEKLVLVYDSSKVLSSEQKEQLKDLLKRYIILAHAVIKNPYLSAKDQTLVKAKFILVNDFYKSIESSL